MMSYPRRRLLALVALSAFAACGGEPTGPSNQPPAHLDAVADLSRTATVGTPVTGGIVVKVTDAGGRPVQGATVALAVTLGNGTTSPRLATSDAKGQATADLDTGDDRRSQRSDRDGLGRRNDGKVLGNWNCGAGHQHFAQSAKRSVAARRRHHANHGAKPRRIRQRGHAEADAHTSRSHADLDRRRGAGSGSASRRGNLCRRRCRVEGR